MTIEKLDASTPDLTRQNIERLLELFPECRTEGSRDDAPMVDFDLLRQALSDYLVEGPAERYRLDWPGKRQALLTANTPIDKTLRPVREESVNFDTTRNLFIEGDNLDALKLLQETYLGKVKLIYIDPPYNTGKDFIYRDNFAQSQADYEKESEQLSTAGERLVANPDSNGRFHSDWLTMMHSRLKLAKNLLSETGVLIISIDENERANLEISLNEIFGEGSFAGEVIWKNSSKNDQDFISIQHEYFIFYAKNKSANGGQWTEKKGGLDEIYAAFEKFKEEHDGDRDAIHAAALEWYRSFPPSHPVSDSKHYNWMDDRGVYFASDLSGPNDGQYVYDVVHPTTDEVCKMPASGWRYPKDEMEQRIKQKKIHFPADHTTVPQNKTYLKDVEFQSLTSIRFLDGRGASSRLKGLFGKKVFTNPKDEILLSEFAKTVGVSDGDIIVDLFAGSGTLGHATRVLNDVHGISCQYVLVTFPERLERMLATAQGSAKKTIRNAIEYLTERNSALTVSALCMERLRLMEGDLIKEDRKGFRALRIDSGNFIDTTISPKDATQAALAGMVSHIKDDRSEEDLLFGALLRWGVDITLPIEKRELTGREVWLVDAPEDGSGIGAALVACFARPDSNGKNGIDTELADVMAELAPLRVLFRDDGFADDATKENVHSRFKQRAPDTQVRVL
jgi:adenine-specific DNA-methyltransferase